MFDFSDLVANAFSEIITTYGLSLVSVDVSEVMLTGDEFALLIWLDRDGTSLKYLDVRDRESPQIFDLVRYLALQRSWKPSPPDVQPLSYADRVREELAATAKALENYAADILRGQKVWLEEVTQKPMSLSAKHLRCLEGGWGSSLANR